MEIEQLIKKIEADKQQLKNSIVSDEGMARLKAVAKEYAGEYHLVWSKDTLEEIKTRPKRETHKSGIPEFDRITGGFRPQQMIGIGAQSGHGKCLAKGTKVLMFDGSTKKIEDIQIGEKIMSPDSKAKTVLDLGYGKEEMFEIKQRGLSYVVNKSHILSLRSNNACIKDKLINISVDEYLNKSDWFKKQYKGWTTGVDFKKKEVGLEPYFLGVWLGDGTSESARITNIEPEIETYLKGYANRLGLKYFKAVYGNKTPTLSITSGEQGGNHSAFSIQSELKKMGLKNNKHIPDLYKINSKDVRLEILAGLIDTDGYLYSNHGTCYEIIQKSENLSNDIVYLCRSLGLSAVLNKCTKSIKGTGFSGEYYRIRIAGDIRNIPVRVKRKRTNFIPQTNVLTSSINITPKGIGEYYGFELDGDGLFLLESFVVTHNTAFGLWVLKAYEKLNPVLIPLEQSSEELIEQRAENGQFIPNYLSPKKHSAHVDPDWIEQRIVESIAKYNSKMVMLDHMGYIEVGADYRREGEHLRIEKKLQALKHLAIKWNVVIVILIQLSQMEEEQAPQLRDLKGSSAIRQELDQILLLWRNNIKQGKARAYNNKVLLSMQKNRFTGINTNAGAEFELDSGEYVFSDNAKDWASELEAGAKSEVKADSQF